MIDKQFQATTGDTLPTMGKFSYGKETQLQRIVRRTEKGDFKDKGILRISFNGFSGSQFFETEEQLKKILKNSNAKTILEFLKNVKKV